MKYALAMLVVFGLVNLTHAADRPQSVHGFTLKSLDGKEVDLSKYKGKVLVIVNVASKCGYTPQYEQLQEVFAKYGPQGVEILGIPCNQFGKQEPGTAAEIREFCTSNYDVTFDMFAKIDVNGENSDPLYNYLTSKEASSADSGPVKWNFEKFVIGKDGKVVSRFRSKVKPDDAKILAVIEAELKK